MNNTKLQAVTNSQTGIAKKVLEAIPFQDAWSRQQVVMELRRTGAAVDLSRIEACIRTLIDAGLVREIQSGQFRRVAPKPEVAKDEPAEQPTPEAPRKTDALTQFAALAATVRAEGERLLVIADQIEEGALAMEQRVTEAGADGAKLRQLATLLKEIA